ncbi:predicted protein, partial [Nematostella vectensis]
MPPWCRKWVFFGVILALSVTPANAQTYIGFDLSDVSVLESAGTATLGLTRSGVVSGESLVTATVTPLTATAGTDYTSPVATNITFSASETSYNFTVSITDDGIIENTESFFIQLTTTDGSINITQPNITVSITNNDKATFSFASSSYSVEEDTGYVTVNITKIGTSDISLDVKLSTNNGTAFSPVDYTAMSDNMVTFLANEQSKLVNITINVDQTVENDEDFKALLSHTNADQVALGLLNTTTITIGNDDQATFSFASSSYSVEEDTGYVTVNITKIGTSDISLDVKLSTNNGTAFSPVDYTAISDNMVTFLANEQSKLVNITINVDQTVENDEDFKALLSHTNADQVALGLLNTTTITIGNDDQATFSFASSSYSVEEDTGYVTVNITKIGTSDISLDVKLSTNNGTAFSPVDYTAMSDNMVTFLANEQSKLVNITINVDQTVENDEDFKALLSHTNADQVALGLLNTTTITIGNDDQATFSFASSSYSVEEDTGYVTVNITKIGTSDISLDVKLSTNNGTAFSPVDYTAISDNMVTFLANEQSKLVNITINVDQTVENDEDFKALLSHTNADQVALGLLNTTTITIGNDDQATFSFASSSYSVEEDTGYVTVNITKIGTSDISLDVKLSTNNGTAFSPVDYTAMSDNMVTFLANEQSKLVNITINVDQTVENDEDFKALLSHTNADQVALGLLNTTTITIGNDDQATFSFASSSYSVEEDTGYVTVNITKIGTSDISLDV